MAASCSGRSAKVVASPRVSSSRSCPTSGSYHTATAASRRGAIWHDAQLRLRDPLAYRRRTIQTESRADRGRAAMLLSHVSRCSKLLLCNGLRHCSGTGEPPGNHGTRFRGRTGDRDSTRRGASEPWAASPWMPETRCGSPAGAFFPRGGRPENAPAASPRTEIRQ
jgi:hypothetical protein